MMKIVTSNKNNPVTSTPCPNIMFYKLLSYPKTCSLSIDCTVLFSMILKLEILNRTFSINIALDGMTKLYKSEMFAIIYIIRYKLQTRFIPIDMNTWKKSGMIRVANI